VKTVLTAEVPFDIYSGILLEGTHCIARHLWALAAMVDSRFSGALPDHAFWISATCMAARAVERRKPIQPFFQVGIIKRLWLVVLPVVHARFSDVFQDALGAFHCLSFSLDALAARETAEGDFVLVCDGHFVGSLSQLI
jgi:hypothetical protein